MRMCEEEPRGSDEGRNSKDHSCRKRISMTMEVQERVAEGHEEKETWRKEEEEKIWKTNRRTTGGGTLDGKNDDDRKGGEDLQLFARRSEGSSSLERPRGYSWLHSSGTSPGGAGGRSTAMKGFTGCAISNKGLYRLGHNQPRALPVEPKSTKGAPVSIS
eukprot:998692-Pyramimonas_sp.AAC.1